MNPDIINSLIAEVWNAQNTHSTQREIINTISQNYNISPASIQISSTPEEVSRGILNVDLTLPAPLNHINDTMPLLHVTKENDEPVLFWFGGFIYNKTYTPNMIVSDDDQFWICTKQTYGEFSPKESLALKYPPWRRARHEEIFKLLDSQKDFAVKQSTKSTETKTRAIKI